MKTLALPSVGKALESLDRLAADIKNAPSFKALDSIATAAAMLQKTFGPVREVADRAGEVWTSAEIRMASELERLPKAIGSRGRLAGRDSSGGTRVQPPENLPEPRPTLAELGIDRGRASRAKQLMAIPGKVRDRYIKELKYEGLGVTPNAILKKHKEDQREHKRKAYAARVCKTDSAESLTALIEAEEKFAVIYADPPWEFSVYSGKGNNRTPDYETMSPQAIAALPVAELADDDCVLMLWTSGPLLAVAMETIKAWSFTYKTIGFVWVKPSIGLGYWTRAETELVLLATKGSPLRLNEDVRQVLNAPAGEHSEKPEEVRKRIERLLPGKYLELFARKRDVPSWVTWGNEV
jgi:N6-adenosine-specific RNA methylase IME4